MNLTLQQIKLFNVAWKLYRIGYYKESDLNKFLRANRII